jgi:hypothetical protein
MCHIKLKLACPMRNNDTGVKLPVPDYEHLTNALKKQCSLANQQPTDYFLLKVTTGTSFQN